MNSLYRTLDKRLTEEQAIKSLACAVVLQTVKDWKRKQKKNGKESHPYRSEIEMTLTEKSINSDTFQYWLDLTGTGITLNDFKKYLYSI